MPSSGYPRILFRGSALPVVPSPLCAGDGRTPKGKGTGPLATLEVMANNILLNIYYCCALYSALLIYHLILIISLSGKLYHAHFIDEKSEVQR